MKMFANHFYQMSNFLLVLKNIVGVLGSSPSHFGSGGFAWILSLLTAYQYILRVYVSFHCQKGKKWEKDKNKKRLISCWMDQQTVVLHQENIGMTTVSYPQVHPWPLCTGCQRLGAIWYLFLFESPSQPSKSPPLFLAFDISACFYTINPFPLPPRSHSLILSKAAVCYGTIQRKTQNALTKGS